MQNNESLIGILNDLTRINNDRFDGYQKALKQISDQEITNLFIEMADQSRKNTSALIGQLLKLRSTTSTGAGLTGNVYSGWSESKKEFSGSDRDGLLDYCDSIESLVTRAYETAINSSGIPEDIRRLLNNQKTGLKGAKKIVKGYYGMLEAIRA